MEINTIVLLVEALLIVGLSAYIWFGVQSAEEVSALHWTALAVLTLVTIGFALTLLSIPLVFG